MFIIDKPSRRVSVVEDPKFNCHTTDLKPLFSNYIVTRNMNAICVVDVKNKQCQTLIEVKNQKLFCEKLDVYRGTEGQATRLLYVKAHNDRAELKQICLPPQFLEVLKSASDL